MKLLGTIARVVKSGANEVKFKVVECSPQLLVGVGVVTFVGTVVLACKATTKASDILDQCNNDLAEIAQAKELAENGKAEYTEENEKRDKAIIFAKTGAKMAKVYAPAVALGVLSVGCFLTANNILQKRYLGVAAAYTAVDKAFKQYRQRVVDELGKDKDMSFMYGVKQEETAYETTNEFGEKTVGKEVKNTLSEENIKKMYSPYSRLFDVGNPYWEKSPDANRFFLNKVQAWANDRLIANKRLFLNEVYEQLGFEKTEAGQKVGWIYDEKNPIGDNYVDFGIYDVYITHNERFINGVEPSAILDFNVDGVILGRTGMPAV